MNILNKILINLGGSLEIAFELILEFQSDANVDTDVDAVVIIQGGIIYPVMNTFPLHSSIFVYLTRALR